MHRTIAYRILIGLLFISLLAASGLQAASLQQQRIWFADAEQAIRDGDQARYRYLKKKLRHYPLLPYLELADLKSRLSQVKKVEIKRFLQRHKNTPVADMLRRSWLNHLVREDRWRDYLVFYTPQRSVTRQCHRLTALIKTGQTRKAWPEVKKIWLHGKSRPSACDPVFNAWENAGKLTTSLRWQRIELALEARQWRLAQYLGKPLSNRDTVWLKRWIRLHRNPRNLQREQDFLSKHPYREKMLGHAVRRMAALHGLEALHLWNSIKSRYPFSKAQRDRTERRIALAIERNPSRLAYDFINRLKVRETDERLHIARLRAGLLREDWPRILQHLSAWSKTGKSTERWQYWYARALDGVGKTSQAQSVWRKLAKDRSYYGFMAADRTNVNYYLAHADTPVTAKNHRTINRLPGIQRAFEWHSLKEDVKARREWHYATKSMDKKQLKAAATLAEEKGWHDRAIFTLAKTGYWDDLQLRFPLRHRELVYENAQQYRLEPNFVFAIIRQESAFMRDARSHAGAMGLMQLMPATARHVARDYLNEKAPSKSALLQAEVNIGLGTAHLRQLMDRFDNNPILVTAAYNAGSHRVKRWLPDKKMPADIWIELVPFKETHGYLRRVMAYSVIYDKRLGRKLTKLKHRMKAVDNADILLAAQTQ